MSSVRQKARSRSPIVPNYVWRLLGALLATPTAVWANCTTSGVSIVCNTPATTLFPNATSTLNNVTLNVGSAGSLSSVIITPAVSLTGNSPTLINNGTIDPNTLSLLGLGASGVVMGNATGGNVAITNTGTLRGSGVDLLGLTSVNLGGVAITARANSSGSININNSGLIAGPSRLPVNVTLNLSGNPTILAYGGAPITVTNTGTIVGQVGLGTSPAGNRMVNAGTIDGGVNMGINSANTFTAVTGSQVVNNGGTIGVAVGDLLSLGLTLPAAGVIDGGAGGNNTLVLQNAASGTGSGTTGTGTASSAVYRNFQNLVINSGTWNVTGTLAAQSTALNGGALLLNDGSTFGTGQVQASGGTLIANAASVTLPNAFNLGSGGLNVQGANALTLNGVVAGSGGLTKGGLGTLTLGNANAYTGGTTLSGGTLALGNAAALGTGGLTVAGTTTLRNNSAMTVGNLVALNGDLTVANDTALTLTNTISGTGALTKSGAGTLTLSGNNTYGGGTALGGGGLIVGGNSALGTGTVTVNGPNTLQSSVAAGLQNTIILNGGTGALTVAGANDLALNGAINGAGRLTKTGTGVLTLGGINSYSGGTTLAGGTVNLGSPTPFGSGAVSVTGATTLNSLGGLTVGNAIALTGAPLTVSGTNALALNGGMTGSGSLVKSGTGSLTLGGTGTYTGGTTLNAGTLVAGANNALGTNQLTVGGAATLDSSAAVTLANAVQLNGALTVAGSNDLTLGGVITGAGQLTKNGAATLTLNGANTNSGGVVLNAGTLSLGNAGALGSGLLTVGGNAVLAAPNLVVTNGVRLGTGTTLGIQTGGGATTLGSATGNIAGAGALALNDAGTLTVSGNNSYQGGTTLNAGRLLLDSDTALGIGPLTVAGAATLDTTAAAAGTRQLANDVTLNAALTVDNANSLNLAGNVTGAGTLVKNGTGLLALNGTGNAYGGLVINAGTAQASSATLGANVQNNANLSLLQNAAGTYAGNISGTGGVDVNGTALLSLSGVNTFTGGLNVLTGAVETRGGQALADTLAVNVASGAELRITDSEALGTLAGTGAVNVGTGATLRLGDSGADGSFGGVLGGIGNIAKGGTGVLVLTGASTNTGVLGVEGGRLQVDGSINNSAVNVGAGATLAGAGSVLGPVTVADNGILSATQGQTLTLGGLALNDNAKVNVTLGAATSTPQALVQVNGNLTLDGQLNVTDAGAGSSLGQFGLGSYRIFGYTGVLVDNGLAIGAIPTGFTPDALALQTSINNQVNLVVGGSNDSVLFWNGTTTTPNSGVVGAAGTWQAGTGNWTDTAGRIPSAWDNSAPRFAIFSGTGGAVSVVGAQNITGLQIAANGYTLNGGALNLAAGTDVLRADAGVTGTINSAISGSGALQKRDFGTLILTGANTYTGGTTVSEGVLQVNADANLGAAGSAVALDGGTLRIDGNAYTGTTRAISVGSGGTLDIAAANSTFTLGQDITGGGRLTKAGAGTLALNGDNSALAGVDLNAGTLSVGSATALGAGALNVNGSAALDSGNALTLANNVVIADAAVLTNTGSNDLILNGVIAGGAGNTGSLIKQGASTLTLNGANTYGGGTTLAGGTIVLGNDGALGSGPLNVSGAGQLLASGARVLGNDITLANALTAGGAGDLTLNGTISGSGPLLKAGTERLTLNGVNTYTGGTQLQGGTLALGNDGAIGAGPLTVAGNAALDSASALALTNAIAVTNVGTTLTVARNNDATLSGAISGDGGLVLGGNHTLTLTGANTYGGDTTLLGGTLLLAADDALGSNAGASTSGGLVVSGPAAIGGTDAGTDLSIGNVIQLDDTLTVTGPKNVALNGSISGAGGLIKDAAATALTIGANNDYSGGTVLQGGALQLLNANALGTGGLAVTGDATLRNGIAGIPANALVVGNDVALGAALTVDGNGAALTLNGVLSGDGALLTQGATDLTLNNLNTYTGGTRIAGGTLTLGNDQALGTGTLTVADASTLAGSGPRVVANAVQLNARLDVDTSTQPVTLNGAIGGAGAIAQLGTGTLTLNGANTYGGGTTLNGGTLVVGNGAALGTGGLNVAASSNLDNGVATALQNDVVLGGSAATALTVAGTNNLELDGAISGAGGLVKNGSAGLILAGNNTFGGGVALNGGAVTLGSATALGTGALTVTNAGTLNSTSTLVATNAVNLNTGSTLTVNGANDLTLGGAIAGDGALIKQDGGTLTLTGTNTYTGGAQLQGGTLIGSAASLGAGGVASSAGTQLTFQQDANGTYGGVLSGAGNVEKTGAGALTLTGANSLTGATVGVAGGTLVAQGGQALTGAGLVRVDTGATLQLDGSESIAALAGGGQVAVQSPAILALGGATDSSFDGMLTGTGGLSKVGSGTLALNGASTLSGNTDINAGTLALNGTLESGAIIVHNGGTLSGNGQATGAVTVQDLGHLDVNAIHGGLTVGSLTLSQDSQIDAGLGAASTSGLINVTGDVALNGRLNVTDVGGFGTGVYRIINYGGSQVGGGALTLGTLPAGVDPANLTLQTVVLGQVNLLNQNSPNEIQFWDGGNVTSDGTIAGGSGTWGGAGGNTNWTDANGANNTTWGGQFAVFQGDPAGAPYTVTVSGPQTITGMQFSTDGYTLTADPTGALVANNSIANGAADNVGIRVEPGLTATIDTPITGTGTIAKRDTGTLVLGGANTYTGGTRVEGGVLQIDANENLGADGTSVAFDGGTLRITGTDMTQLGSTTANRDVTLEAGGGTFDIAAPAATVAVGGTISGAGALGKTGSGTLLLAGDNTYAGGTQLTGGTLQVGSSGALGTGTLTAAGGTTLSNTAPVTLTNTVDLQGNVTLATATPMTLSGTVGGSGGFTKTAAADLTLTSANTYQGDTQLNEGAIVVGGNSALGTGTLIAADGTQLDTTAPGATVANNVTLNGVLTVRGTNDLVMAGSIGGDPGSGGAVGIVKDGPATLTLNGPNGYAGTTQLNGGRLVVASNSALGTSTLVTAAGTSLDSTQPVVLANAVQLDGSTTVVGSNDMTLQGTVAGAGGLVKDGPATLTLTGANAYGGGTALNSGTLIVGNDAALGTGALVAADGTALSSQGNVTLANIVTTNGALAIPGSDDLTLSGTVDGAGSLNKSGSGTLTLNGTNTYTGGTTLAGGTLVVGNGAALGPGTVTVNADSTLQTAPAVTLDNAIALNGGTLTAATPALGDTTTLSGNITGAGALTKAGAGTLILGGTNRYSGGTTVAGGTLQGNTDSLQGTIVTSTGTAVAFDQTTNGTFNGSISGAGGVVKNGAGAVTLNGANSYTGGTTVAAGTLIGDSTSLQGNIDNSGTVVFNQTGNGAYNGNIQGSGTLIKQGGAALTLSGSNQVGGGTTVSQGSLLVDGTLSGGPVTVDAGAFLGGSGVVTSDVTLGDNAHLVAGTPSNPISFAGGLTLSNATQLDFTLGSPNTPTTAVTVAGNLVADGVLNVANAGNLGTGIYHLFQSAGTLTNNGIVYGSLPTGFTADNFTLQTSVPRQINLLVETTPGEIQFWNGSKTLADGQIAGGTGTWGSGTNWTDAAGTTSQTWNDRYAAFAGVGGTVTVDGAKTVTGMQFLSDGYTLTGGAGAEIALSQTTTPIRVDTGATATLGVPLTGAGGLSKENGGTLVLTSPNTYTGGTTVASGTLQVSADNQLGDAAGAVNLNGGTLAIADAAYAGTDRAVTLGAAGGDIAVVAAGQDFTLGQALTGSGALTKSGAGTLVLASGSNYSGGTHITGGTLAGDSASLQGSINSAAGTTLRFDQSTDGSFNGSLAGSGQLVKNGTGALTLTQPNSYTGGTQINTGTLIGDTGSLQGNIVDNASLVFNQTTDGTFNGTLSGTGSLTKRGAGTLTASGSNPFSGNVVVAQGTLALGTAGAPANLPASVQVNSGAALAGAGRISSLVNAGTVATAPAQTLQVAGNFINAPSGTLQVNLGPPAAGALNVAGTAALNGTLQVADGFQYSGTNSYAVVTAAQGVQGTFTTAALPDLAFLDSSVSYDPNNVYVNFARNQTGFDDLAQTPNESAVAEALQGLSTSSPLYASVLGLSRDNAAKTFRQLSGDSHASLPSALISSAETVRTMPMNRLRDSLYSDSNQSGKPCADDLTPQSAAMLSCRRNVWADVIGNWQHQDGGGNAPSYKQETGGVMVGGDVEVHDGWRVGAAFGYQDSTIRQDSRNAKADVDSYSLTLFGGKAFAMPNGNALNVLGGVAYSWQDLRTRRNVAIGSDNQNLKANYSGNTTQVFGEVGYSVPLNASVSVEPFAGLAYADQRMRGFSEDGGSAALHAGSDRTHVTTSTMGLRGRLDTEIAGQPARLRASLGWRHAMGGVDPERSMAFDTGPAFTVQGAPIARNALVTEVGAEMAVSRSATLGVSYSGQFGDGNRQNAGFVNLRWSF
ncbi:autotransporter-associated beta strand repeat-containing protein [Bordetella sp. LUAb4]|uniref:autotransporter-associated beta strand repeat-containing protein n=1 Tax=Bordetella sp. LUAb4 TaxID=2843195 RepID=UPI001E342A4B|nr:autotransporter-associated beta strand repeat-containing protein [Bordetella sp. LUAb4]